MSIESASNPLATLRTGLVSRWLRIFATAEYLFLMFGSAACLILLLLIPPLAGGNETNNFQRVAAISAGHLLIEPASVPASVTKLLDAAGRDFPEGAKPPYRYAVSRLRVLAAIPLSRNIVTTLYPNAIAVLNPVAYMPQVLGYWLGLVLGLPPLALFYLGRIFGGVAAIGLTFLAIRRMPFHRYALAGIALLPTIMFSRSTLDADQLTNAVAFFFAANVFAAMADSRRLTASSIATLVVSGFLIAQCKSAYVVLPLLAIAIPAAHYGSRWRWLLASAMIVLPGAALDIAWMVALKHTYFAGLHYHTWAGSVYPDGQMARILASPPAYLTVVLRTVFLSNLIPTTLIGFIGVFGPPVSMPLAFYLVLLAVLFFVLTGEAGGKVAQMPEAARWLAGGIFSGGFLLVLTLLYIQWDGLGAHTITGFQGRYLYPLAVPLLIFLRRAQPAPHFGLDSSWWTGTLGGTALFGTLFVTWSTYWG